MKVKLLVPALIATMFMLNACGEEEEAKPVAKTYTPSVTATVNNQPWTAGQ
jgi:hypothetical protein